MTLDEVKKHLSRYKEKVHQGNQTARNYVEAVELLLSLLNTSSNNTDDVKQTSGT